MGGTETKKIATLHCWRRDPTHPEAGRRGVVQVLDALDHHARLGEDALDAVGEGVERLEQDPAPAVRPAPIVCERE